MVLTGKIIYIPLLVKYRIVINSALNSLMFSDTAGLYGEVISLKYLGVIDQS